MVRRTAAVSARGYFKQTAHWNGFRSPHCGKLEMEQSCVPPRLLFKYAHDWSVREACMNNIIYLVGLVVVVVAVLSFFGLR